MTSPYILDLAVSQELLTLWGERRDMAHWVQMHSDERPLKQGERVIVHGTDGAHAWATVVDPGRWTCIEFDNPVGIPNTPHSESQRHFHHVRWDIPFPSLVQRKNVPNMDVLGLVLGIYHKEHRWSPYNLALEERFAVLCWDCDVVYVLPKGAER